jgi:hypothetical protein
MWKVTILDGETGEDGEVCRDLLYLLKAKKQEEIHSLAHVSLTII